MEKQELLETFIIELINHGNLPEGINPKRLAERFIQRIELVKNPDTGNYTTKQAQEIMFKGMAKRDTSRAI